MAWNKIRTLTVVLLITSAGFAQVAENRYIVYFTTKVNTPFSVNNPSAYLSQKAIDRRTNQNISVDQRDLPVDPALIGSVLDLGEVTLLGKMKWMNAILIETTDPDVLEGILLLDDVGALEVSTTVPGTNPVHKGSTPVAIPKLNEEYGAAFDQIDQLNGLGLHNDGFTGDGMWIAVLDGGFSDTDSASVLAPLLDSNRLLGTRNFVLGGTEVYGQSAHGTMVLSTMAAEEPFLMIGTAPAASYLLCVTEDVSQERRIEEALWIMGAEYADSVGVDIINTSLGYSDFDVETENYTYADMDGNTALITRGADIAASRGMLVVSSAGNQGGTDWNYITAPADGDSVLAIGAVWVDGTATDFSSRGPSVDGRVKPNVMARGGQAVITNRADSIMTGNGTSFAAPILTGMAACLWQAFPEANAWEIHQAIEESSSLYFTPNDSMGLGIPNFEVARYLLWQVLSTRNNIRTLNIATAYPNPFTKGQMFTLLLPESMKGQGQVSVIDFSGRQVASFNTLLQRSLNAPQLRESLQHISAGMYMICVRDETGSIATSKVVVR